VSAVRGGIHVNGDTPDFLCPALAAFSIQYRVGEGVGQTEQVSCCRRVLEARQRRLGGKRLATTLTRQEHGRVAAQVGRVIGVGIAAGDSENALLQHIADWVAYLAHLTRIAKSDSPSVSQIPLFICGLEEKQAAVGRLIRRGKFDADWFVHRILEQDTLFGFLWHNLYLRLPRMALLFHAQRSNQRAVRLSFVNNSG